MEVRTRFQLVDATICSFIFAPIVVLFWHGFFGVLDDVILRQSPYFGAWLIIAIGIAIQVSASCFQEPLYNCIVGYSDERHKAFILTYNFVLGSAQILQFRGLNDLYEFYIGLGVYDAISATVTSVVILCGLRLCSQTVDIPFVLGIDSTRPLTDTFKYTGYHGTNPGTHRDHILDAFSTIAVMQTCVHLFSIASFIAIDSGLFKQVPFLAMTSSWIGGYAVFVLFWLFAHIIQDLSRGMVGDNGATFLVRFFVDLMMIGEGLGVVMIWHGHWVLYDVMSYWLPISIFGKNVTPYCAVIGAFVILSLCHISSSLVRSGISRDETDSCIDCIGINATYFTHFFNEDIKERESKCNKNNNEELSTAEEEVSSKKTTRQKSRDQSKPETGVKSRKRVTLQDLIQSDKHKKNK